MVKVFIAGHRGMVGSAICRQLNMNNIELITAKRDQLDLTNQLQVENFLKVKKVDQVYLAAAKVGGIHANNAYPADFIYENLMIQNNIIHSSYRSGVKKLLFLGSSCIYPKLAKQPMAEDDLLSGYLEPTNEPYAIAKIAGIKMCESYNRQYGVDYRSIMPSNLYGPGDNYHSENSHVIPALIRRFHEAKERDEDEVVVWGSGLVMREFLHVDDMASAALHVMNLEIRDYRQHTTPMLSHLNVGTGTDCTIKELTEIISDIVGFKGSIKWDIAKPDGAPRKLMDSNKLFGLGWQPSLTLRDGLEDTYRWYLDNLSLARIS
ncbi:MAG: GDP-L-fucose synthase [bacterium]|nr:GDP-L-fucose synthase [bacterium]